MPKEISINAKSELACMRFHKKNIDRAFKRVSLDLF